MQSLQSTVARHFFPLCSGKGEPPFPRGGVKVLPKDAASNARAKQIYDFGVTATAGFASRAAVWAWFPQGFPRFLPP